MAISMYQASVPSLIRGLENLHACVRSAQSYAEEKKIEPTVLTNSRLYPDMLPLKWQIYIATDTAKFTVSRLTEVDVPKFEDTQETLIELGDRIAKTVTFLKTISAAQFDGTEDKQIVLERPSGDLKYTGLQYVLAYALPNFYFHVTTAYDILRHCGVPLGKRDYLGDIASQKSNS